MEAMDNNNACSIVPDGLRIEVHLQPGARREAFAGMYGERLKIAVSAPPVDGRANCAVIRFLADFFGVAARNVELISGEKSRDKKFLIRGNSAELMEKVKEVLP